MACAQFVRVAVRVRQMPLESCVSRRTARRGHGSRPVSDMAGSDLLGVATVTLLLAGLYRVAAPLARLTRLPSITICLIAGAAARGLGLISADIASGLLPLHQAALAVITLAAGSELDLESLRTNYSIVRNLTLGITAAAFVCVFTLGLAVMATVLPPGGSLASLTQSTAASALAAVVAIARSPSSAIGVVSELNADGPFTQCILSVTMVTDVVVVVLFTAAIEVVDAVLHEAEAAGVDAMGGVMVVGTDDHSIGTVVLRFCSRTAMHLGLSLGLGAVLCALCLGLLRLPTSGLGRLARPVGLLLVGRLAFAAEAGLHVLLHGTRLDDLIRLEPMLACISAGFALCNWCGVRRRFEGLLHGCMPAVLTFFFISVGCAMDFAALAHSWPVASTLFGARLLSIRLGCALGALATPQAPPAVRARYAWLAFLTQAGVGLGLAEEVGDKFAGWGADLRSSLVATIVLNQLVGPPLLRHALRSAGEAGRRAAMPQDKLAEHLTRQISDPTTVRAILAAAAAAAKALPSAVAGAAEPLASRLDGLFPGSSLPRSQR